MQRPSPIVLGKPWAPLLPAVTQPVASVPHWRRWRRDGVALSVLLHVAALAALTVSAPVLGGPAERQRERVLPVEVVPPPSARKHETQKPTPPAAMKIPDPPQPKPPPRLPAAKSAPPPPASHASPAPAAPAPEPRAAAPEPQSPALSKARPPPAPAAPRQQAAAPNPATPEQPPRPTVLPGRRVPPAAPPVPNLREPHPPRAGVKIDPEDPAPPDRKKGLAYWVLDPVTVDLGNRNCGLARITGVLELQERVSDGRYRGKMRTRIAWTFCPPEGVLHEVELRVTNGEVVMVGSSGFIDRGVIGNDMMMLEDAYGRSVWRKR